MSVGAANGEMASNPAAELDSAKTRILELEAAVAARDERIETLEKKLASLAATKESVACQTGETDSIDASSVTAGPEFGPVVPGETTPREIGLSDLPQELIDMVVERFVRRARWTTTQRPSRLSSVILVTDSTSSCAIAISIVKTFFFSQLSTESSLRRPLDPSGNTLRIQTTFENFLNRNLKVQAAVRALTSGPRSEVYASAVRCFGIPEPSGCSTLGPAPRVLP
jgi:hypothetical protein